MGSRKEGFQRCKDLPPTCSTRVQYCFPGHWEPGGSDGKESTRIAGNPGSIPALGRSSEEGNGYPLQYSFLENSMDRGAWWATVPGIAKSRNLRLNNSNISRLNENTFEDYSWQKPTQYCKAVILQLKLTFLKRLFIEQPIVG